MYNNDEIGTGWMGVPFLMYGGIKELDGVKISNERYQVYVNGDFIGNKDILTQNDDVFDLEKYLTNQGFHDFETKLEGNRFQIKAGKEQSKHMKDTLNVYLHIR